MNSNVIGSISRGKSLMMLDHEHFGTTSGNVISISHVSRGPKDFIVVDEGISFVTCHLKTAKIAIAPFNPESDVEVIEFPSQTTYVYLPNPTGNRLISLSFSYDGDNILGISDSDSQDVLYWNVSSGQLLFTWVLSSCPIFTNCSLNPCDANSFSLYGNGNIYFGIIDATLGVYSVQTLPAFTSSDESFLLWLPSNLSLTVNSTGLLNIYNLKQRSASCLGIIKNPVNDKIPFIPSTAVITLEGLVVGSISGDFVWLSINFPNLIKVPADVSLNSIVLVDGIMQHAKVGAKVMSILPIDSEFEAALIETADSCISHMPLKLAQNASVVENEESLNGEVPITSLPSTMFSTLMESTNEAIYATCSCTVPIVKQEFEDSFLTCFVTASYSGFLSFWRLPHQEEANSTKKAAEIFQKIKMYSPTSNSNRNTAIITSMKFDCSSPGHKPHLLLGYDDGYFQVFKLSAVELEEDDAFNYDDKHCGLFEDDGILFLFDISETFSIRLFDTPITAIAQDSVGIHIACVSAVSDEAYILKYLQPKKLTVVKRVSLKGHGDVLSVSWSANDSYITFITANSKILCFYSEYGGDLSIPYQPDKIYHLGNSLFGAFTKLDKNHCLYQTSDSSTFSLQLMDNLDGIMTQASSFDLFNTMGYVVCTDLSENKCLLAAGTINGSVFIWQLDYSDLKKSQLIYKSRPHNDAVVSVSFSYDYRALLSVSCDSSFFITKVDCNPKTAFDIRPEKASSEPKKNKYDSSTWYQIFQKDENAKIIHRHNDNVNEILSDLQELQNEVQQVVLANESKDDVDKVSRNELVIDTDAEEDSKKTTITLINDTKSEYENAISLNELVAARMRSVCYDNFDVKSSTLLPLFSKHNGPDTKYLSSFPVRRLTHDEKLCIDKIKRLRAIEIKSQRYHDFGHIDGIQGKHLRSSWRSSQQGCPMPMPWVVDGVVADGACPVNNLYQNNASVSKMEDDDDASMGSEVVDDERPLSSGDLLYPIMSIRTQNQKRSQIFLLMDINTSARLKFNADYQLLRSEKEDALAAINSRISRINEIEVELNTNDSQDYIKLDEIEIEGSEINVLLTELKTVPYETESMRSQRAIVEAAKIKLDLENSRRDVKERALDDMMDGVLEAKSKFNLTTVSAPEKPVWADEMLPSEMTDTQLKKFEEYEANLKLIAEEKLKYRKSIEQEMKKLKLEIGDLIKTFNDKYQSLIDTKMNYTRSLLVNELFDTLISRSMVNKDFHWYSYLKLKPAVDQSNHLVNETGKRIKSIKKYMEELSTRILALQEEEKLLDKSFKRDIQQVYSAQVNAVTLDQEKLKTFVQIYKSRQYPSYHEEAILNDFDGDASRMNEDEEEMRGSSSRASQSKDFSGGRASRASRVSKRNSNRASESHFSRLNRQSKVRGKGESSAGVKDSSILGPMQEAARALRGGDNKEEVKDAYQISTLYLNKQKRSAMILVPLNNQIRNEVDCPAGFIQGFAWAKLQDLRSARIEKEICEKTLMNELSVLKTKLDEAIESEIAEEENKAKVITMRNVLRQLISDEEINLELLIRFKQGQDEIIKSSVKLEYSDALLMPTAVVKSFNKRIIELGKEKVLLLSKIKMFRRKINLVGWKVEHLDLVAKHLGHYYTDLQLLRVTKELQQVLRQGAVLDTFKSKTNRYSSKKEFLENDANSRKDHLLKLRNTIKGKLNKSEAETLRLEELIQELSSQVYSRKHIKQNRDMARGKSNIDPIDAAALKMKGVISRKQLVDVARCQAEEIIIMRQELDRLRQRTFPSFVKSTKQRISNV